MIVPLYYNKIGCQYIIIFLYYKPATWRRGGTPPPGRGAGPGRPPYMGPQGIEPCSTD